MSKKINTRGIKKGLQKAGKSLLNGIGTTIAFPFYLIFETEAGPSIAITALLGTGVSVLFSDSLEENRAEDLLEKFPPITPIKSSHTPIDIYGFIPDKNIKKIIETNRHPDKEPQKTTNIRYSSPFLKQEYTLNSDIEPVMVDAWQKNVNHHSQQFSKKTESINEVTSQNSYINYKFSNLEYKIYIPDSLAQALKNKQTTGFNPTKLEHLKHVLKGSSFSGYVEKVDSTDSTQPGLALRDGLIFPISMEEADPKKVHSKVKTPYNVPLNDESMNAFAIDLHTLSQIKSDDIHYIPDHSTCFNLGKKTISNPFSNATGQQDAVYNLVNHKLQNMAMVESYTAMIPKKLTNELKKNDFNKRNPGHWAKLFNIELNGNPEQVITEILLEHHISVPITVQNIKDGYEQNLFNKILENKVYMDPKLSYRHADFQNIKWDDTNVLGLSTWATEQISKHFFTKDLEGLIKHIGAYEQQTVTNVGQPRAKILNQALGVLKMDKNTICPK